MKNRALAVIATGEYNTFIPKLIETAEQCFGGTIYLFTDKIDYTRPKNIHHIPTRHYGWPKMPLMRWEIFRQFKDIFEEEYIFVVDADTKFVRNINHSVNEKRVGVLHRNVTRWRKDFNYERRPLSNAYVHPLEGEKYFACGFCGGERAEFLRMTETIADSIKEDVENGIRAIWGDESHVNRYFIDNPPTLVLPPNYMCPETNHYFVPYIQHQAKDFKKVNKEDAVEYLTINPKDYNDLI